jgi:hypothetical protein
MLLKKHGITKKIIKNKITTMNNYTGSDRPPFSSTQNPAIVHPGIRSFHLEGQYKLGAGIALNENNYHPRNREVGIRYHIYMSWTLSYAGYRPAAIWIARRVGDTKELCLPVRGIAASENQSDEITDSSIFWGKRVV